MNARNDLDQQLSAYLREGPTELPYQSFDAVRDRTEQTRQRVVIGPWRTPIMNRLVTVGFAAAAVVIAVFVGAQVFGSPTGGFGSQATPTPSPSPTAVSRPSATPVSAPPLSQTFTSTLYGISLSYPQGWKKQDATAPWTDSTFPLNFDGPQADFLYDPIQTSNLFLTVASQPIGDSTPADWMATQMAGSEGCTSTSPITVGGAAGMIGGDGCDVVVVTRADRGYWIQLYTSGDNPAAVAPYNRAWFEEVLATVELRPADATQ